MWWPGTELNRRRQPFQGCSRPSLNSCNAYLCCHSNPHFGLSYWTHNGPKQIRPMRMLVVRQIVNCVWMVLFAQRQCSEFPTERFACVNLHIDDRGRCSGGRGTSPARAGICGIRRTSPNRPTPHNWAGCLLFDIYMSRLYALMHENYDSAF